MSTHVVLVHPEIHWNTGNAGRTCLAAGADLHLIKPLGFSLSERQLKRAGLDYWNEVELHRHRDIQGLYTSIGGARFVYCSKKAKLPYFEWPFEPNDYLVFGSETKGLSEELLATNRERCIRIPMPNAKVRSLNLANSVAIVLYEALRQIKRW